MGRPWRKLSGFGAGGRLTVLLASALAACALAATSAGAAPLVLVGTEAESVLVVNSQTHELTGGAIGLGTEPGAIAIVPGGQAFVGEIDDEAVAAVDLMARKLVTTIPVGPNPRYLAVSPDGKTVYVADDGAPEISVIDTATDTSLGSIPLGAKPYSVTFAPNGTFAYATTAAGLEVIDTATSRVVGKPIEVGEGPRTVAFSPNGHFAYVADEGSEAISVVDNVLRRTITMIEIPGSLIENLALSPDGSKLYVNDRDAPGVRVFSTQTREQIGATIPTSPQAFEIALTPDGKTLWIADQGADEIIPVEAATAKAGTPVPLPGTQPWQVAVTPDQSPTAAFTVPGATATQPTTFSGAASSDPDGTVVGWNWDFGDGGSASGVSVSHTFAAAGNFLTKLSVIDNEGCGETVLITGRTAFCGGNPAASSTQAVTVAPVAPPPILCSSRFAIGGITHNHRNGTVRLRVRLPSTGSLVLFGSKVHAVTRKVRKAGVMMLTVHARVELAKLLKKTHHASVRVRISYFPSAGCSPTTVHRSFALLRAPSKKKSHRH